MQAFHGDVNSKGEMVIIGKGMVYAKMLYGEMGLFFGGMASPLT